MIDAHTNVRKLLHVDLDAFFAAVEELDHPELAGKPIAVANDHRRGILTTCNYPARAFGLHSAMPVFQAKARCPGLILMPPRFERYKAMSESVFKILRTYSRRIEPVSIDEAYLDVTSHPEDAVLIAESLRSEVLDLTGLSISVGISYNKFFAKLASDWQKPHGIFQITPDDVPDLLAPLPVRKIHGLGRTGAQALERFGITTIGDLYAVERPVLERLLGKQGDAIYRYIRGRDDRPVEVSHERKSIGMERTFSEDLTTRAALAALIPGFSKRLSDALKKRHLVARTFHLKLKTSAFKLITRSHSLPDATSDAERIEALESLMLDAVEIEAPIRLFGVSASNLSDEDVRQLRFF